jgi:hypothetical protein
MVGVHAKVSGRIGCPQTFILWLGYFNSTLTKGVV